MSELEDLRRRVAELEAERARHDLAQDALRGSRFSAEATFFEDVAVELARAAGAEFAFVGELAPDARRVRTVGLCAEGKVVPGFEYDLAKTPCENVVGQDICAYPRGVTSLFPEDLLLKEMGIDGYCGVPLFGARRRPIGLLVVLSRRPLTNIRGLESLLRLAAVRVSAELDRVRSEERLKALFDAPMMGVFFWEADGGIRQANDAFLGIVGYGREELEDGRLKWTALTPEEFAGLDARALEQVKATGFCAPYEKDYVRKDGTRVPVLVGGSRIRESPLAGVAFVLDRSALRASGDLNRQILGSLQEGLAVLGPDMRFLHFNPVLERMTGRAAREVLGRRPQEAFPDLQETGLFVDLEQALKGEVRAARLVRWPGAPRRWASMRVSPLRDLAGARAGAIAVVRDVTELKEVEDALRESEQRLSEALARAQDRVVQLEEQVQSRTSFEGLVGKSPAMQDVYRRLRMAAGSDVTVLITGESGTGKEMAAASVHSLSARKGRPFVAVNCSAIPEGVLESELFGHVKGAFTGATRDKMGLFQAAQGGTLFLDEVGDMSPSLQVKVLRALQEREVRRVGDDRTVKVDVRLVTATNRDLESLIAEGKLREDFYYRIRVFEIGLPPLRERREDIPLLLQHFVEAFSTALRKPAKGLTPDALRRLLAHDWPGNVRELRNAVEHAFVTLRSETLRLEDFPPELQGRTRPAKAGPRARTAEQEEECRRIAEELRRCNGNRTQAARRLGISRVTLWNKINRFGLE